MQYWLLKTEPTVYSYEDLERDQRTVWDGIANNVALKYLRGAQPGDLALVYHTGSERRAVGVAEVTSGAYPDPRLDGDAAVKAQVVDVVARKRLARPVDLDSVKVRAEFLDSPLVRQGRLSFVPLTAAQWKAFLSLGGTKL